jgi:hypothetical protein
MENWTIGHLDKWTIYKWTKMDKNAQMGNGQMDNGQLDKNGQNDSKSKADSPVFEKFKPYIHSSS